MFWKLVEACDKKTVVTYVSINFPSKGSKWNPQVDCLLVWKPVEAPCEVSPKFPMQENKKNYRVDYLQVWKLVETTCEVSPMFPMQGISVKSSDWLFPGVETT